MGKVAKVRRWVSIFAPAGSSGWRRATTASTRWSVVIMSAFQSKKRSTSAEPRLVTEVTFRRPGTLFTASSIGRVMVTSIWSMGMTPLSTPITMRGKSVLGKTATGILKARYAPTRAMLMVTNKMGRESLRNQGVDSAAFCMGEESMRRYSLSLAAGPLAVGAAGFFATGCEGASLLPLPVASFFLSVVAAGLLAFSESDSAAGAASTFILVLSGTA